MRDSEKGSSRVAVEKVDVPSPPKPHVKVVADSESQEFPTVCAEYRSAETKEPLQATQRPTLESIKSIDL